MTPASNIATEFKPSRLLLYALMIVGAIGAFALVRHFGLDLRAAEPAEGAQRFGQSAGGGREVTTLLRLLLLLTLMIVCSRVAGWLFRFIGQPPVIGEVIVGIMLGPSLLGQVWPEAVSFMFTGEVSQRLRAIASVGVILYMFLVGLELNPRASGVRAHATVVISHASIVVPFVLGASLALLLYPLLSSSDVPFVVFALFMGVCMSVTAFPVLARILTDQGLQRSPLGTLALTCAAVDDVTAWCLLAFVVGVARSRPGDTLTTIALTVVFILVMAFLVRPLLRNLAARADKEGTLTQRTMALVVIVMLLCAVATESIGIHALFGAFLVGALIPHDSLVAREMTARLHDLVLILFLPAFFAYTGMQTQIGLVRGAEQWALCGLIIVVACLGKFGGATGAARLCGIGWRESGALGALMNTRGLMQLIVLNVGLNLHVLTPRLYAMLVLMAIVTTMTTAPVLRLLTRGGKPTTVPRIDEGAGGASLTPA